jgi:hypothetical protein
LYWAVGYCHGSNTTVYAWSSTNAFTITNGTPQWDRSLLATPDPLAIDTAPTYLAGKGHPFIGVTQSTRVAASNYLFASIAGYLSGTNDHIIYDLGHGFQSITNTAGRAITNTVYWPTNVMAGGGFSGNAISGEWAIDIADVCLMWVLTRDATWSNAHPEVALNYCANYYLTNGGYKTDVIADSKYDDLERTLALGYDWCYDLMDSTTKSNVLYALAMRSRYMLCGFTFGLWESLTPAYTDAKGDPTGAYTDGFRVRPGSISKWGHSHGTDNCNNSFVTGMAGGADHPWCAQWFNYYVNFMLGPTYIFKNVMGSGRPYTEVHIWEKKAMLTHCFAQMALPEIGFTNNPFWKKMGDWWDLGLPMGLYQGHEAWGDTTIGREDLWQNDHFGRELSLFTQNGAYMRHWKNEWEYWKNVLNHGTSLDSFETALIPYNFPHPQITDTDTTNLNLFYPNEGWLMSVPSAPGNLACFTNGVGLIMQAKPAGSIRGHSHVNDGTYQIWAYGANVTDLGAATSTGGYGNINGVPWVTGLQLMVNGFSIFTPQYKMIEPWYSRFYAYTNGGSFLYCAADITKAYCRSNFSISGDGIPVAFVNLQSGGPTPYVSNVTRQVVFNRSKYFVVYDTVQTGNAATNTFHDVYNVQMDTLNLDTNLMSFTYTSTNAYNTNLFVTNYVSYITDPSTLTVTDQSGTNVRINPITLENEWTNGVGDVGDKWARAHALWFGNKTPANSFHFMKVIYPVKWGDTAPTITRLDNNTVAVTNGSEWDVIGFDTNTASSFNASIVVNVSGAPQNSFAGAPTSISGPMRISGPFTFK